MKFQDRKGRKNHQESACLGGRQGRGVLGRNMLSDDHELYDERGWIAQVYACVQIKQLFT